MKKPPFRADHVGSLLRPNSIKQARTRHIDKGDISAEELRSIEDEAIKNAIAVQQDVGLQAVTDGEYRRSFWHYDFMGELEGFDLVERDEGVQFAGVKLRPIFPTISDKLSFPANHPHIEHYKFVAAHTDVCPKI